MLERAFGSADGSSRWLAVVPIGERVWTVMDANAPPGYGFGLGPRVPPEYLEQRGHWHPSHVTLVPNGILALRASLEGHVQDYLQQGER